MIKNVYYQGKLIPAKDWDFEKKRPKVKEQVKMPKVLTPEPEVTETPEESTTPEE